MTPTDHSTTDSVSDTTPADSDINSGTAPAHRPAHKSGPLTGLLVVALEQAVAAPLCTSRLQRAGARVIKIERPEGDFARQYDQAANGASSYFIWTNQGKESLVLNIKDPTDQRLLSNLLSQADVLVQNLKPGALARAGFDPTTLNTMNPRLITCNISGYGNSEALKHMKAYDLLVQAETGLIATSGGPGAPGRIGISVCDIGAGVTAHAAILEALIQRGITNRGSSIDISLFDVAAEWMSVPYVHARHGNGAPTRQGLQHPGIAPYGAYLTADNISTLVSIQNEREWVVFCRDVLQNEPLATDGSFNTNTLRVKHRNALNTTIQSVLSTLTATQFRARLQQADIAFAALNSVDDLVEHMALRTETARDENGHVVELPAHPFATPPDSNARLPSVGEHTDTIRQEFGS